MGFELEVTLTKDGRPENSEDVIFWVYYSRRVRTEPVSLETGFYSSNLTPGFYRYDSKRFFTIPEVIGWARLTDCPDVIKEEIQRRKHAKKNS